MAKAEKKPKPAKADKKPGRIKQLVESYHITKRADPRIGLILLGWLLGVGIVVYVVTALLYQSWTFIPAILGILTGLLAALIVFGRRAQSSAIRQIEGKPGAAASVLSTLRRGWKIDSAIAFNRQQDVVHRLVGPPGIVLIGEGNQNRLRQLLTSERRKHERVASEVQIQDIVVGDAEGQVPLARLVKFVSKQKRTLKPAEMTDVLARLKALDASRSNVPLPKGPIPTSMKGMRQNMRGR